MLQRQVVNIATDLSNNANRVFTVPFNLRFVPDEMIVKAVTYTDDNGDPGKVACQVSADLIEDQIISFFVQVISQRLPAPMNFRFLGRGNWPQVLSKFSIPRRAKAIQEMVSWLMQKLVGF